MLIRRNCQPISPLFVCGIIYLDIFLCLRNLKKLYNINIIFRSLEISWCKMYGSCMLFFVSFVRYKDKYLFEMSYIFLINIFIFVKYVSNLICPFTIHNTHKSTHFVHLSSMLFRYILLKLMLLMYIMMHKYSFRRYFKEKYLWNCSF
jgi:hypothetical protein